MGSLRASGAWPGRSRWPSIEFVSAANRLPRISAWLVAASTLALVGCCGVQYQKGFLLKNKSHVDYYDSGEAPVHAEGDLVRLFDPPIVIRLGGPEPRTDFLAVGPIALIPLPLIPWPPGIIGALLSRPGPRIGNDKLKISLAFSVHNRFYYWGLNRDGDRISTYEVDPRQIVLRAEGRTLYPIATEAHAFSENWDSQKNVRASADTTSKCFPPTSGGVATFAISTGSECHGVTITLTFDINYSAIKEGLLEIKGLALNGAPVSIAPTRLRPGGRFKFWAPIIND